jgi:hypothetical protein
VKDNISLIAAATGGFMLSVALSGILRGTPVVSWQQSSSFHPAMIADLHLASSKKEKSSSGEFASHRH